METNTDNDRMNDQTYESVVHQHYNIQTKYADRTMLFLDRVGNALKFFVGDEKECNYLDDHERFMLNGIVYECSDMIREINLQKNDILLGANTMLHDRGLTEIDSNKDSE